MSAPWRAKSFIIEVVLLAVGAAFAAMFNFTYLAAALALLIPFTIMPNQFRIMAVASKRAEEMVRLKNLANDPREIAEFIENSTKQSAGILWARAFLKMTIVLFVMFQFIGRTFIIPLDWIALLIGIVAYFSMSMTYKKGKPWKQIEGWMRFALAIFNSALLWTTFTGQTAALGAVLLSLGVIVLIPVIGPIIFLVVLFATMGASFLSPATGLFFLALAFFAVPPVLKEEVY